MKKGKKETLYSLIITLGSKLVTYFLLLALANFFTQAVYGRASFVLSVFQIILYFAVIGLPNIFVPWHIKKKDTTSVSYFLLIFTLIITFVAILISLKYLWILPIILTLPFILFLEIGRSVLRAQYKYHIALFFNLILVSVTLISLLFLKDLGKLGIITSYALGYFIISISVIYLTKKELLKIFSKFKLNFKQIKVYIKKSIITSSILIAFLFLGWIDSTILGILSTFENVAKYNIAGPISNILAVIPTTLSLFLLTRSAEVKDVTLSKSILNRTLRISFSFSLILAIILNSLIFLFLKIFFPRYIGIEVFVMILSIGIIFFAIYSLISTYLMGKLKPEIAFVPIAIAAFLNIILDIILVPYFHLYGIVFATAFAHLTALTLFLIKIGLFKKLKYTYLTILILPIAFYLSYYGLLLLLIVTPLLFYFKLIEKSDIKVILQTILRK